MSNNVDLSHSLNWDTAPEEIESIIQSTLKDADAVLDKIASFQGSDCTWENVIVPFIAMDSDMERKLAAATFLKDVSTDDSVRKSSANAMSSLSAWTVSAGMREDVFKAVTAAIQNTDQSGLDDEGKRFCEKTLLEYKRAGLFLPKPERTQLEGLKTLISDLCLDYQQRLGEWKEKLYFTREELAGMEDSFIDSLEKTADGKYTLTLAYPHVVPVQKQCKVRSTRKAVDIAFNTRGGPSNVALLETIATLRRYEAHLLGYPSHAHYILEDRLVKTPENVQSFYTDLVKNIRPLQSRDLDDLTKRKIADESSGSESDKKDNGILTNYDYRYYENQELIEKYSVDRNEIMKYFPTQHVVTEMLKLYESILSLKFEEVQRPTWHKDVKVFAVYDDSAALEGRKPTAADGAWVQNEAKPGDLVGYFYLDLHPREGKYGHAAVFPLVSGAASGNAERNGNPSGDRVIPLAACVCNFPDTLLPHEDVVTLFHEFGHVMHHLTSRSRLKKFASFACEADFVEAPSQMLEHWTWCEVPLQRLSKRVASSASGSSANPNEKEPTTSEKSESVPEGSPLPDELLAKLKASKNAFNGIFNMRQIQLGQFDYRIHSLPSVAPPADIDFISLAKEVKAYDDKSTYDFKKIFPQLSEIDTRSIIEDLSKTITKIPVTEGTNFGGSFGHMVGGYSAQYFSYLYSEVFAADMFKNVFQTAPDGVMDALAGYKYRTFILAPGGARSAADSLKGILGREPNQEAFLEEKGITVN